MTEITIEGVKKYRSKGRDYYYLRATGKRIVDPVTLKPLDPAADPEAFVQRVAAMKAAGVPRKAVVIGPAKAATMLELVYAWTGRPARPAKDGVPAQSAIEPSPEWAALRPATRKSYLRVVDPEDGFIVRSLKKGHTLDDIHLDLLDKPWVVRIRNKVKALSGFWFANYTVTVLSGLFKWGGLYGHMTSNPAEDVPRLNRPDDLPDQHRSWAEDEYDAMYAGALKRGWKGIALAFVVARYGGWATGDCCHQPASVWQDPRMVYVRRKKRKKTITSYRVPSVLLVALRKLAPPPDAPALILNEAGEAYTEDGLRSMVWRLNSELKTEGKVAMGLTIHGLRHSLGKELYDLGIEKQARKALMSHQSDAASTVYERDGDRAAQADAAVVALDRAHATRSKP